MASDREAGVAGRWVVDDHAIHRLGERKLTQWQIVEGLERQRR